MKETTFIISIFMKKPNLKIHYRPSNKNVPNIVVAKIMVKVKERDAKM